MRYVLATIAFVTVLNAAAVADPSATHEIDTSKSHAQFSVQHVFVDVVTGTVPITSGTLVFGSDTRVPVSLKATLDPKRIETGDDDRNGVMQTPDWFDTKRFPIWTYTSTKVTPTASGFGVDGLLTMHGVTVPEHLDVIVHGDATHPLYHAVAHIDRHLFGMAVTRLDPVIGGDVTVTLDIALK
jgi:polyisoprenoid-binding protein YceI